MQTKTRSCDDRPRTSPPLRWLILLAVLVVSPAMRAQEANADVTTLDVVVVPSPALASGAASSPATGSVLPPLSPAEEEPVEYVTLCDFGILLPDHMWIVTIADQSIGLIGYAAETQVCLAGASVTLPWRAPLVAGGLGVAVLLFLGGLAALGPRGAFTRGTV